MRAYISPYFIRRGKTIFRHNPGYRRVINSTKDFPSRHHSRKWLNMYICYLLLHLPCQQTFGCLSQRIYARCIPINIRSEDITTGSRIGNFHWKAITANAQCIGISGWCQLPRHFHQLGRKGRNGERPFNGHRVHGTENYRKDHRLDILYFIQIRPPIQGRHYQ